MKMNLLKKNKKDNNQESAYVIPITYEHTESTMFKGSNGKMRFCFRSSPINADLMTDTDIENVVEHFSRWINILKGRCQISLLSQIVDLTQNIKNHEKEILNADSDLDIEILRRSIEHFKELSDKTNKVMNYYFVIESPFDSINSTQQYFDKVFTEFNALLGEYVTTFILDNETHFNLMQSIVNPDSAPRQFTNRIDPDYLEITNEHLKTENKYFSFFYLSNYSSEISEYRALKDLFKYKKEAYINITLTPKDKTKLRKSIQSDYEFFEIREEQNKTAAFNEFTELKDSAKSMLKNMSSPNYKFFDVSISYAIPYMDKSEIESVEGDGETIVNIATGKKIYASKRFFDCFKNILPILDDNETFSKFCWNMDSELIASLLPFDSSEYMDGKGTILGKNMISEGVNTLHFHNPDFDNRHLSIIAYPGAGKTTTLKTWIDRVYPFYDHVFILDLKGDLIFPYGSRYTFEVGSGIITNIFHISSDVYVTEQGVRNDLKAVIDNKVIDISEGFVWLIDDYSMADKRNVESICYELYDQFGLNSESTELPEVFPTFAEFYPIVEARLSDPNINVRQLESLEKIRDGIESFTKGASSSMFNGQQSWDFKASKMVVLDLSKTKKSMMQYLYDSIIKTFWDMAIKNGSMNPPRILFVADELHLIADKNKPQTLEFCSTYISKLGRGFGIDFWNATQNIPDFMAIEEGKKIIDNSFFKYIMKLGQSDLQEAIRLFELSQEELKYVKPIAANKGKGIFFIGSHKITNANIMTKDQMEWIIPKEYERKYGKRSRYLK